ASPLRRSRAPSLAERRTDRRDASGAPIAGAIDVPRTAVPALVMGRALRGAAGDDAPGAEGRIPRRFPMFDTLEMSLSVLEQLAPVETKIRQRRKSLADEVGRAAESVALNVS